MKRASKNFVQIREALKSQVSLRELVEEFDNYDQLRTAESLAKYYPSEDLMPKTIL